MALPVGRGMFTLFSYHPVPTEPLPIPKLNLTGMLNSLFQRGRKYDQVSARWYYFEYFCLKKKSVFLKSLVIFKYCNSCSGY